MGKKKKKLECPPPSFGVDRKFPPSPAHTASRNTKKGGQKAVFGQDRRGGGGGGGDKVFFLGKKGEGNRVRHRTKRGKTFKILTFSDHQRKCVFPLCCLYTVNVFLTLQQTNRERKEFSEFRMGENEAGKMHNSLLAYVEGFRERPDFQKKEHRPKLKGNANENWIRDIFFLLNGPSFSQTRPKAFY